MRDKPCEGECEQHVGEVRLVRVAHLPSGYEWGAFHYCEEAVSEDRRRGLQVTYAAADQKAAMQRATDVAQELGLYGEKEPKCD